MWSKHITSCGRGLLALLVAPVIAGCSDEAFIGGTLGLTLVGGATPSHEIQQIYYLGAFDPQGQVPPTVYRIRVHGQASFISFTKFASGWVPAPLIDSLSSSVGFKDEKSSTIEISDAAAKEFGKLTTGRRLMMFGPEGFREAPKDHRLVIVMGSNPSAFFEAIDSTLGIISEARAVQRGENLDRELFEALAAIRGERTRLEALARATSSSGQTAAGGAR